MDLRIVLENNKQLGHIKAYNFIKTLTGSFYKVMFHDGTIIKFKPVVGSNQNEIKVTTDTLKVKYSFKLGEAPKVIGTY